MSETITITKAALGITLVANLSLLIYLIKCYTDGNRILNQYKRIYESTPRVYPAPSLSRSMRILNAILLLPKL